MVQINSHGQHQRGRKVLFSGRGYLQSSRQIYHTTKSRAATPGAFTFISPTFNSLQIIYHSLIFFVVIYYVCCLCLFVRACVLWEQRYLSSSMPYSWPIEQFLAEMRVLIRTNVSCRYQYREKDLESHLFFSRPNLYKYLFFLRNILFLHHLYTQYGTQTHDPEIKSCTLDATPHAESAKHSQISWYFKSVAPLSVTAPSLSVLSFSNVRDIMMSCFECFVFNYPSIFVTNLCQMLALETVLLLKGAWGGSTLKLKSSGHLGLSVG